MTAPGRTLGRYELQRRLAMGGMGEIYLACARGAGGFEKQVIIKTILPHLAEEEEFVTKFLDEGRIVVQLTHGNIVPVFDMGEEAGTYFIAMEYVPGLDLRALLKRMKARDETLPVEMALYIASEVCKGLSYAHRKSDPDGNPLSIVHRDVSPSNVLISSEGEVKIIDFGIARAAGKLSQTASGAIQGKCCYMSPEQARGLPLDARSDIFSVGVLLYEMLTGVRPFEGRSDLESLELVRTCQYDPPSVLRPELSDELDEILAQTMALDPDDRYEAIDELYIDLQQETYRQGLTVTGQQIATCLAGVFADAAAGEPFAGKPANIDEALQLEFARLDETPSLAEPLGLAFTATSSAEDSTRTIAEGTPAHPSLPGPEPEDHHSQEFPAKASGETSPELDEHTGEPADTTPTRRPGPALFILLTIVAGLLLAFFLFPRGTHDATLSLVSAPPGATIHLDGEELAGRRTPQTLSLPPGDYRIELRLDDHLPRSFRVVLSSGEEVSLGPDELRLMQESRPPRTFQITVDPSGATLLADGEPLEIPAEIALDPGEVVNLSASAEGCAPTNYTLSYGHSRQEIRLTLACADNGDPEAEEADETEVASASRDTRTSLLRPRTRRVLITTEPSGAELRVDGEPAGQTPTYVRLTDGQPSIVEARLSGYRTRRSAINPRDLQNNSLELLLEAAPTGCLSFRAIYPANNEIAINGQWLPGRHMSLREHPLPAGEHRITVRHPESGKEETFPVEIDAGHPCRVLTVWERE